MNIVGYIYIYYVDLRTSSFFYHIWAVYQCVESGTALSLVISKCAIFENTKQDEGNESP